MGNTSEIEFKIKFQFEGNYPESRVKELMQKIADALYHEYSSGNGFAPDDEDDVLTASCTLKYGNVHLEDNYYDKHVKGRYTHTLDLNDK